MLDSTLMNLLNRELFKFPSVVAFPKASRIGLNEKIFFEVSKFTAVDSHKNWTICLLDSLLPDPVSPDINIDCDFFSNCNDRRARFAANRFIEKLSIVLDKKIAHSLL